MPGDIIVGVGGDAAKDLVDFYRKIWATGEAGVEVPLTVLSGARLREVPVRSVDRHSHLKLKRTY